MFKPNKLVKVVSILLIIFGVLSVVSLGISYVGVQQLESMPGVDPQLLETAKSAFTPLNLAISLGSVLLSIICGILGVAGKAFKAAVILMIVYIAIDIISLITAGIALTGLMMVSVAIGFVLPILYLWGLYQSKE